MTDNEIIKALECCVNTELDCEKDCPIYDYCEENSSNMVKAVLDLINRQKAEVKTLQALVDDMGDYFPTCIGCEGKTIIGEYTDECVYLIDTTNYCSKRGLANIISIQEENRKLKADIERLKEQVNLWQEEASSVGCENEWLKACLKNAKAEAIKECLDKVAVFCAESGLFRCEADEMLLFNYLDSLKMQAMLEANGMAGESNV